MFRRRIQTDCFLSVAKSSSSSHTARPVQAPVATASSSSSSSFLAFITGTRTNRPCCAAEVTNHQQQHFSNLPILNIQ
ncbi:hypothetical protein quinque_007290 [Culex quinquefasciatus]